MLAAEIISIYKNRGKKKWTHPRSEQVNGKMVAKEEDIGVIINCVQQCPFNLPTSHVGRMNDPIVRMPPFPCQMQPPIFTMVKRCSHGNQLLHPIGAFCAHHLHQVGMLHNLYILRRKQLIWLDPLLYQVKMWITADFGYYWMLLFSLFVNK